MRALPCNTASCPTQSAEGLYRGRATLRDKSLYLLGRTPTAFPYSYRCASCKRPTVITAQDWARLPTLTVAELEELGALAALTKDLRGAGYAPHEAVDLYVAGYSSPVPLEPLVWDEGTKKQFQEALAAEPSKDPEA